MLDACREALLRNAGGPEEFLAIRANFAASVAALSVTGYITGAGDRHTENFLLHRASGTLVPIDFGCTSCPCCFHNPQKSSPCFVTVQVAHK